jgi:hypothetical protein
MRTLRRLVEPSEVRALELGESAGYFVPEFMASDAYRRLCEPG